MMPGLYILNERRCPIVPESMIAFAAFMAITSNKVIARTEMAQGYVVSTVFLGAEHGTFAGKSVLWETMVFRSTTNFEDLDSLRYTSHDEATTGHYTMISKWNRRLLFVLPKPASEDD